MPQPGVRLALQVKPELRVSPSLFADIQLLQLNVADFQAALKDLLAENVLLDKVDNLESKQDKKAEQAREAMQARIVSKAITSERWRYYKLPEGKEDINVRPSKKEFDPLSIVAAKKPTITEHLIEQLRTYSNRDTRKLLATAKKGMFEKMIRYSPSLALLMSKAKKKDINSAIDDYECSIILEAAEYIIYNLDKHGRFQSGGGLFGLQASFFAQKSIESPSKQDLLFGLALALVQSLEPGGVGVRDVAECLLVQLALDPQEYHTERILLKDHWDSLLRGKAKTVAKQLQITRSDIQDSLDLISWLDPHPGRRFRVDTHDYIKPDASITLEGTELVIRTLKKEERWVAITPKHRRMLREARDNPELLKKLREQLSEARSFLAVLEYRESMFVLILKEVAKAQREFLLTGNNLKPLKMIDIAKTLGVTSSTISRLCKDRNIETQQGTLPLRMFFDPGNVKGPKIEPGKRIMYTNHYALSVFDSIIKTEDILNPYTDHELVEELEKREIFVALRNCSEVQGKTGHTLLLPA